MSKLYDSEGNTILCNKDQVNLMLDSGVAFKENPKADESEESEDDDQDRTELQLIAAGTVAELKDSLGDLSTEELEELLGLEKDGSARQTAVDAINAEMLNN